MNELKKEVGNKEKAKSDIDRRNMPSMLNLMCNSIEVMRLRQVLLNAYH